MKRIKFKLPVIVALTLLILVGLAGFYGCSGDDNSLQPTTQNAAQNLHDRFAELFEDFEDNESKGHETTLLKPAVPAVAMQTIESDTANIAPPPPSTTTVSSVGLESDTNENENYYIIAEYDEAYEAIEYVEIDEPGAIEVEDVHVYEELTEPLELFAIPPSGRRFHLEHCHHARNASDLLTREAAEARGLTPCGTCRP